MNQPIPAETFTTEADEMCVDWNYLHYRREFGSVTAMLSWNFASAGHEPILLLAPTYWDSEDEENPGVCVIPLSDAWKWSRTHNNEKDMVGERTVNTSGDKWQEANATYYAMQMNLDANMQSVNKVRGLIEDHLGDLAAMPPAPDRTTAKATFTVTDIETGAVKEVEISE